MSEKIKAYLPANSNLTIQSLKDEIKPGITLAFTESPNYHGIAEQIYAPTYFSQAMSACHCIWRNGLNLYKVSYDLARVLIVIDTGDITIDICAQAVSNTTPTFFFFFPRENRIWKVRDTRDTLD